MLESEIEKFFVNKVALNKGMAIKLYSPSFTGLMFCIKINGAGQPLRVCSYSSSSSTYSSMSPG